MKFLRHHAPVLHFLVYSFWYRIEKAFYTVHVRHTHQDVHYLLNIAVWLCIPLFSFLLSPITILSQSEREGLLRSNAQYSQTAITTNSQTALVSTKSTIRIIAPFERKPVDVSNHIIFGGFLSQIAVSGGNDFFDNRLKLGAQKRSFELSQSFGGFGKIYLSQNILVGLSTEFYRTEFGEVYVERFLPPSVTDSLQRSVTYSQNTTSLPVMAFAEYTYQYQQFVSYVGGGIGFSSNTLSSSEGVNSPFEDDQRTTNAALRERSFASMAFMGYLGMELRFDRNRNNENFLQGLFFHVRWLQIPVSAPYFTNIAEQFPESGVPTGNSTLNLGGFSAMLGISMKLKKPD